MSESKPRRGARPLDIEGRRWWWRAGSWNVEIWSPSGERHVTDMAKVSGRDPDVIERGQHKKTGDGMIKPGHIRRYIRQALSGKGPPSWYKPERPEHGANPVLAQCAKQGMSGEEALDQLALAYGEQGARYADLLSRVVLKQEGFQVKAKDESNGTSCRD